MSDFDAVLERLVSDPAFAAALAADPDRTLAGFRLTPDEVELLHTQVGGDPGGQRGVEVRANQSSLFGMLSPLSGIVGGLGIGDQLSGPGTPDSGSAQGLGPAASPAAGFGPATQSGAGFGSVPQPNEGFGPAEQGGQGAGAMVGGAVGAALGGADPVEGFGDRGADLPGGRLAGVGEQIGQAVRAAHDGLAGAGQQVGQAVQADGGPGATGIGAALPADVSPPEGYHTRVDVDGDGHWDRHSLRGRIDGGVDILVDADRDGRVDFVGYDDDADGRVDSADYDKDHDGFFEKRMYDDNGDGWLDRTVRTPRR